MMQYVIKILLSAVLITAIAEIAKRSTLWAALLASLPITSVLAFIWLYVDTGDAMKVAQLASDVLWLVVPSLVFFWILPMLLHRGINFWLGLLIAAACTIVAYFGTLRMMKLF